jgi:trehalose 6-phosphate synthase
MRACEDLLGASCDGTTVLHRGRRVAVTVAPISIDPAEFEALAHSESVLDRERQLLEQHPGRIVLRVDRTDPSKNLVRGFAAWEAYLDAHPEVHGEVVLLALLDPSRQEIPAYEAYLAAADEAVRRVNERFGRDGWLPVDLRIRDDFASSLAAYKQFDVLFVNAVYDGLNLVSKEAMLVNERDGVLVLSENAGAFEELGDWAIPVNPFDVAEQAEAIHRALELPPDERRARGEAIRAHVRAHDLDHWIARQLESFDGLSLTP